MWFLHGIERQALVQISMSLSPYVFIPTESPPAQCLYVIHRGAVLYEGRLLTKDKCWGDDVILSTDRYRSSSLARAMTYLEAYSLTHEALMTVVYQFPAASYLVRRRALCMALRRAVILLAATSRMRENFMAPAATSLRSALRRNASERNTTSPKRKARATFADRFSSKGSSKSVTVVVAEAAKEAEGAQGGAPCSERRPSQPLRSPSQLQVDVPVGRETSTSVELVTPEEGGEAGGSKSRI